MPASTRTRLEALERRTWAGDPLESLSDGELRAWMSILELAREGRITEGDAALKALPASTQERLGAVWADAAARVAHG